MKKLWPLLFLISCTPEKKDEAEILLSFIPERYSLKDTVQGDLNLDGRKDLLLLMEDEGEGNRILKVLITNDKGEYEEAVATSTAVYCRTCNDLDTYQGIKVKEGEFSIEHFGGPEQRWARTTTFRYMGSVKDWYLTEDALVHSGTDDNIEAKILTPKDFGEVTLREFNLYKE
jgi:hypothetical protein